MSAQGRPIFRLRSECESRSLWWSAQFLRSGDGACELAALIEQRERPLRDIQLGAQLAALRHANHVARCVVSQLAVAPAVILVLDVAPAPIPARRTIVERDRVRLEP